jgi:NAD(P)-dependent dehydrogenase (short-subunit alcohol dehydrogenase family)
MEPVIFSAPRYDLAGKVAVITGSTRGLGLCMAAQMAAAGADVVITNPRQDECDEVSQAFRNQGYKAVGIAADVCETDQIGAMVQKTIETFGKIDILVNNAGVGGEEKPILDTTGQDWDFIQNIDLKGLYFTSKIIAQTMKDNGTGGRIINISSAAGILAAKYTSVYATAKAAVIHLTKVMANEWARYGINVNAVAPGYITTSMTKAVIADEKNASAVLKKISMRRFGEPDDVAGVVLFLATEASKYITGALIPVDGGMTIN